MSSVNYDQMYETLITSLAVDPALNYLQWRIDISNLAREIEPTNFPDGLHHFGQDVADSEWIAAHPPGVDAHGVAVPALQRPTLTRPIPHNAAASGATINLYNKAVKEFEVYTVGTALLKMKVVRSLGPDITLILSEPGVGLRNLSVPNIIERVRQLHGTVTSADLAKQNQKLKTPFTSAATFAKDAAILQQSFTFLATQGHPKCKFDQLDLLDKAIAHVPAVARLVSQYKELEPSIDNRTFQTTVAYVLQRIPNLTVTDFNYAGNAYSSDTDTITFAGKATSSSVSTLSAEHREIIEAAQRIIQNASKKQKNNAPSRTNKKTDGPKLYCYLHGYQYSHTGDECLVMANTGTHYSTEMKKATNPTVVPGGNLRGK